MTTGALKMYFRELPEPLFTYALFHDFVSAISTSRNFYAIRNLPLDLLLLLSIKRTGTRQYRVPAVCWSVDFRISLQLCLENLKYYPGSI